jgi:chorismate synthase
MEFTVHPANMSTLTYQTAGESHGPGLITLVNGMPAGVEIDVDFINAELTRRQGGYGRGGRMRIESDKVEFLAGIRRGHTTGAPIAMLIRNKDSRLENAEKTPPVFRPRPGHADLAGSIKWLTTDCRDALERASARETAARTAAGALAQCFLREFDIETFGFVRGMLDAITDISIDEDILQELIEKREASDVYCPDPEISEKIIAHIRKAKMDKDTVGGVAEVIVFGCPPGIGTCANWDQRLDARLAGAVMGIQAFKAVEIGLGTECAFRRGSEVHDPIEFDPAQVEQSNLGFIRPTNNAGGIEGGMSNGMPIVIRGTMKPISTLLRGMPSVDLNTKQIDQSAYERSDICALPAASVVMENVVAFEIARAFLEKFGGDTMHEVQAGYETYMQMARNLPLEPADDESGLPSPRETNEEQTEA